MPLVVGNVGDRKLVDAAARRTPASTPSSISPRTPSCPNRSSNPLKYYGNNTCATRSLLEAASQAGVKHFVFSSTAAVYGIPAAGHRLRRIADRADQRLRHLEADVRVDAARPVRGHPAAPRRAALLQRRRLRPAGPHRPVDARKATLLVKVACEAAVGKRPHLSVFGTDYPTPDGTGVRDYIHVEDLATRAPECARLPARRRRVADRELRLRPRLQRARGARRAWRRSPASSSTCAKSRAAPATRPRWSPSADRVRDAARLAAAARRHRHHRAHLARVGKASAAGTLVARR